MYPPGRTLLPPFFTIGSVLPAGYTHGGFHEPSIDRSRQGLHGERSRGFIQTAVFSLPGLKAPKG